MKLLILLGLAVVFSTVPLVALTDEDEWSSEKHMIMGKGICIIALLGLVYSSIIGSAPLQAGGTALGVQGLWHLARGFTGWGLEVENQNNTNSNQAA